MKHETHNIEHGIKDFVNYENNFHDRLKEKIDNYIHLVYQVTKNFPREELYGVTSQLRRSVMSIMLNYIEGYARNRNKVYKNFLEISYGSLKESGYLLEFSMVEHYLSEQDYKQAVLMGDEIGAMIWSVLRKL